MELHFILSRFALWLLVLGAAMQLCARLFFKRDLFALGLAAWTEGAAGSLFALIIGVLMVASAPALFWPAHGEYDEAWLWVGRTAAVVGGVIGAAMGAGLVVIGAVMGAGLVWLAQSRLKRILAAPQRGRRRRR